jgi:chemotaxis protein MotB
MARQHKHEEEEHPDETWLVPYSDVLTLLLALFIVLFAVSKVDTEKFKSMAESFSVVFSGSQGFLPNMISEQSTSMPQPTGLSQGSGNELDDTQMNSVLNSFVEANNLQNLVAINPTSSGFTVRMLDGILFMPSSDRLLSNAFPVLDKIAELAGQAPYYINIEGHTDDTLSISDENWRLSINRALAVLKYMQHKGVDPKKLSVAGFGEYHPVLPNITDANRAINRRVEINFISPEYFEHTHYRE